MSIHKYVTAHVGLLYLKSWHLRASPVESFNDPFETRVWTEYFSEGDGTADDLMRQIEAAATQAGEEFAIPSNLLHRRLDPDILDFIVGQLRRWEALDHINWLTGKIDVVIQRLIQRAFGVLCFTATGKHLLMWAHYADQHRGLLLQFDQSHPSFKRRQSEADECGWLRQVRYADARFGAVPQSINSLDALYGLSGPTDSLLATKALEWAYEQEIRMLWPLSTPDHAISAPTGEPLCLVSFPAECLEAVVLGCRATATLKEQVSELLNRADPAKRISLHEASIARGEFRLNYDPVKR